MVNKILGYIITIVGVVGIILSSEGVSKALSIPIPSTLTGNVLLIISAVLIVIGLGLSVKGSAKKQPAEVPIYEGKNVVGYRRMGKK